MWLIPSSIRSRCALASACSTKASAPDANTSACEPAFWLTLSGTATQRPVSWRGWKSRAWSRRLFGAAISSDSIAASCVAEWIALLPDSLVSHGARPARSAAPTTNDGSGPQSLESFARLNRHCAGSKTCQDLFLEVAPSTSYLNLPGSGSMRNGLIQKRPRWAPRTNANASSFWPSSGAEDSESCGNHPGATDSLSGAVSMWPPTTAQDAASSSADAKYGTANRASGTTLTDAIRKWPTPHGFQAGNGPDGNEFSTMARAWATPNTARRGTETPEEKLARQIKNKAGCSDLLTQAEYWTIPSARDGDPRRCPTKPDSKAWANKVARGSVNAAGMLSDDLSSSASAWPTPRAEERMQENSADGYLALSKATQAWPTSAARDFRSEEGGVATTDHYNRPAGPSLPAFVLYSPQVQATPDGQISSGSTPPARPRLNPVFVCWLMGWPSHWTRAEPISFGAQETALWRSKLQRDLSCLLGD